jgi:hypothetical protein
MRMHVLDAIAPNLHVNRTRDMFAMMFRFRDDVEIFDVMLFVLLQASLHQVLTLVSIRHFQIPVNNPED